jgi:signal transduction histidine kinase
MLDLSMKNQTQFKKEQLIDAKQTLELIAFFAYEFKSQLASITNSVNLLAQESSRSGHDFETGIIGNILSSHHYLEARTSELLDLVKLQVEGLHLELEPIDIDTIVQGVVERLLPIICDRGQSLTLNLACNAPKIVADSLRIEQVFHHLVSNASKSTPVGGSILISTNKQAGYVVVKIQDSSLRVPQKEQHSLFQLHYQHKVDKGKQVSEIGLGLALCKHLIELHGGRIWMENEGNSSNIFAFTLSLDNS